MLVKGSPDILLVNYYHMKSKQQWIAKEMVYVLIEWADVLITQYIVCLFP